MNFKARSSNITRVLYIVLVLCIISIMFLSIYSMFNQKEKEENQLQNNQNNNEENNINNFVVNNDNALQNDGGGGDGEEEAVFDFFKPKPTEAPTQRPTEKPTQPQKPSESKEEIIPTENTVIPPDNQESTTDKTADIIIDAVDDAVEVLSVPTIYIKPVSGQISRNHNPDNPEYSIAMNDYRTHMGIDIDSEVGIKVKAVSDGVIADIFDDPLMGKTVVIDHAGNIQSIYMNLQEDLPKNISIGTTVKAGDVIGGVGETALIEISDVPHLHFEMKKDGSYTDPLEYFK